EIVLEQYYLLDSSFTLNTIRVATELNYGKSVFMYNRDMSILYYYTSEQINLIKNFNIHHTTFTKHLNNGTYYLGKYLFLREPVLTAKVKDISDFDLALMLENDRIKFNKNKPLNSLSKSALRADVNNLDNTIILPSLAECVKYFQNKGFIASQVT